MEILNSMMSSPIFNDYLTVDSTPLLGLHGISSVHSAGFFNAERLPTYPLSSYSFLMCTLGNLIYSVALIINYMLVSPNLYLFLPFHLMPTLFSDFETVSPM